MPESAGSISQVTHSSGGSRRNGTKKYKLISRQSNVDETLFGQPHKDQIKRGVGVIREENRRLSAPGALHDGGRRRNQPESIQIVTKDLIRKLAIPREDPDGQSIIFDQEEYSRLLSSSRFLPKEARKQLADRIQKEKEELQDACERRKNEMANLDENRKQNAKLNDLEEEAKQRAQYLLERANELRQEQEDEVKDLNGLILNAKCHAIRDTQILEKDIIAKEIEEESKRLDYMMEDRRLKEIRMQEEIDERRKQEKYEGAVVIMEQMARREEDRLLEQDKREQEAKVLRKYLEKLEEEDFQEMERRKVMQQETMKSILESNVDAEQRRRAGKEQEKLEDLKVLQFMKEKAEREAAYEEEVERKKAEKEREVARLRALQERAQDVQAEKDALRAKRNREATERAWRKKELEEEKKKQEMEDELKVARHRQVLLKEQFIGLEAARDKAEFYRVLDAQQRAIEKEQAEHVEVARRRKIHADEIRRQIREKEQSRIEARNLFFQEGLQVEEEARLRRQKLDAVKEKKLAELREAGVPDKYCREVNRRVAAPAPVGIR